MTKVELSNLWATYFTSPFPEESAPFWMTYNPTIIDKALRILANKCKTYQFPTLADATRYATSVMRTMQQTTAQNGAPAPTLNTDKPVPYGVKNYVVQTIQKALTDNHRLTRSQLLQECYKACCKYEGGSIPNFGTAFNIIFTSLLRDKNLFITGQTSKGTPVFSLSEVSR